MIKIRSEKHLAFVRSHPCCLTRDGEHCNGKPVVAHHITIAGGQGAGTKECDGLTVPLCAERHHVGHEGALHKMGERIFWNIWELDPFEIAREMREKSPCKKIKKFSRSDDGR